MQQQKLFRSSVAIREELNGYYTVYASTRFEHESIGDSAEYPHLSWTEANDLVEALLADWAVVRSRHHVSITAKEPWTQLSLLG